MLYGLLTFTEGFPLARALLFEAAMNIQGTDHDGAFKISLGPKVIIRFHFHTCPSNFFNYPQFGNHDCDTQTSNISS